MIVDGISFQAPLRNHSESYQPRYMILLVYILLLYYISLFQTARLCTHMSKKLFVQWNDIQEKN